MIRPYLLLILLVPFFTTSVSAQYKRKTQKLADKLFEEGDYYNATKFYKDLLNMDSSTAKHNYQYAEGLRMTNYYDKALYYYKKTYRMDHGKQYPNALFWLAQMYKYNYDYTKAKRYFKRTERYYRGMKNTFFYAKVKQEQEACDLAIKLYKNPVDVEITNIGEGVNSVNSEFSGYMLNDTQMVYASQRKEVDSLTNDTYFNIRIYEAIMEQGNWETTEKRLDNINSAIYHTANGVLNTRKNKFYYTICDTGGCQIFESIYFKGEWSEPKNLGNKINDEGSTTTHPFVARMDGEDVMFFASNRKGGYGNQDIWYAILYSNGEFGEVKNAGKWVNTPGNEITPFYHKESENLFFSSDWHKGLGGFDIFSSQNMSGKFVAPKNMGFPINSSVMDFYFRVFDETAMITSNRKGSFSNKSETCCNDIYTFPLILEKKKVKAEIELAYDSLMAYLPMRLFFHNDEPDPRSNQSTTDANYIKTYESYLDMLDRYKREYSRGLKGDDKLDAIDEITDFFDLEVKEGAEDLEKFTSILLRELNKGRKIELTVKGYASPLSKSDYNANLTQRRIVSIENYFKNYENGVLLKYLSKGQLNIIQKPFGEDQSDVSVSDNVNDQRNSIYSKKAAFERRVEIISVDLEE